MAQCEKNPYCQRRKKKHSGQCYGKGVSRYRQGLETEV